MTPLLTTRSHEYKFRVFLNSDYRYGFNMRSNNNVYTMLSQNVKISQSFPDSVFLGTHSFATSIETVMYTPWYFYGFRFGIISYFQGGVVAARGEQLLKNKFYSGVGAGILIKNDNLIFPTLLITGFFYPSVEHANPYFQFNFINSIGFSLPDFNVSGTRVENLQN